jgi:hypothetical protein
MQRSKQQALMFLLGAFLVGGALGFSAERVLRHEEAGEPTRRQMRDRFYDYVQFDSAQRLGVDSILDQRNREWDEVMKTVRPRLDSIRQAARGRIRERLHDDQRARYESFLVQQDTAKSRSKD